MPGVAGDDARHADHDAVDQLGARPVGRRISVRAGASIASIAARGVDAASSTSWRARISPSRSQIAPRRKRAPRSRPSTSAASGTGSKKTAP